MPTPSITKIIAELPFEKKLAAAGSILMIVSLFFPWYQDLDSFRTGDTYIGLNGPMYFAGFTLLVLASLSLLVIITDYLDKKIPLFNVKAARFHLLTGIFSFYMLFLIGSVYFNSHFGVNITLKQSQFGMFMAYISASLITIGGYFSGRERKSIMKDFEKETREAVIKVPNPEQRKPRENLRSAPAPAPVVQQPAMDLNVPETEQVAATPTQDTDSSYKAQPYRMDL